MLLPSRREDAARAKPAVVKNDLLLLLLLFLTFGEDEEEGNIMNVKRQHNCYTREHEEMTGLDALVAL
jgi:hypothetical protein